MSEDLNSYGTYIGSIIIMLVFIVGLIIIIDEIYNMTKFCYRYTYLYNYGKVNENTCKDSKLEYETARFRIYNEIAKYKFDKDLFSKSWFNYIYIISILLLSILLCIGFGYLFKYLFIDNNIDCEVNDPYSNEEKEGWSMLKLIMRCFCGNCHQLIPNCLTNYILLGIILIIYPLIYILKIFFKVDFTFKGGYITKMFHVIFFILIVFYTYYIYIEKESGKELLSTAMIKPKYLKIFIYLIFICIFYANNYFLNNKFEDYNNLYLFKNLSTNTNIDDNNIDTTFFDIYKQEEPIKPVPIEKPSFLNEFKYCSSNDFSNPNNKYCSMVNSKKKETIYYRHTDPYYKCLYNNQDFKYKDQIDKYISEKNYYAIDKLIIDDYYKKLKKYEDDLRIYTYKYNIYKNNKNEFPEIVYFLFTMLPRMLGINKQEIQLLLILIIIVIFLVYYLKINDNIHTNYVYYTIYLYLLGIISLTILVNAILTYNTYVNKYLIYEPLHNYKNMLYNKNIILNMIINNDITLKKLYEINTDKFKEKLLNSGLNQNMRYKLKKSEESEPILATLDEFVNKIKLNPTEINRSADFYNFNSPIPFNADQFTISPSTESPSAIDHLLNIQLKFYKTIYSSILDKSIKNLNENIQPKFLINRTINNRSDNYIKFNFYKTKDDTTPYILTLNSGALISRVNTEIVYFFKLIEKCFINNDNDIMKRINQLKLNMDYYIYNNPSGMSMKDYSNTSSITFTNFIDIRTNYTNKEILRDNDSKNSKDPYLNGIIKNYKYNKQLIDKAFDIYAEFLKEFRKIIITFLNNNGVLCNYNDNIDINNKLLQIKKKIFNINNPKDDTTLSFKTIPQETNIDIYKTILINTMTKINDLMTKYFNLIKIYIRSFTTIPDFIIENSETTNDNITQSSIIKTIISNYNLYNIDSKRHIDSTFIRKFFNIDPNYKKSKYDTYDTTDIKKIKISTDNVSMSFIILIIIFTIILIEPIVI